MRKKRGKSLHIGGQEWQYRKGRAGLALWDSNEKLHYVRWEQFYLDVDPMEKDLIYDKYGLSPQIVPRLVKTWILKHFFPPK